MKCRFAIVEDGVVVEAQGADMAVPWWSFTKVVIAAAALALVRDGRLALDWPLPNKPYSLRQLLQHQAGLPEYGDLPAYHAAVARGAAPWPQAELLERVDAARLLYEPGRGWRYSNIGYLFVRLVIEETTGETLGAALRRLVLRPAGIDRARIAETRAGLADVSLGAADSYDPGWVYHGLMVGSLREAAIWLHRLMMGDLLPPSLLDEMRNAVRLGGPVPGRPWNMAAYGLGLMSGFTSDGRKAVGHTGAGPGSVVAIYHFPEAAPSSTVAAFAPGDHQADAENAAFARDRHATPERDGPDKPGHDA